jgi:hypothetical protein
VMPSPACLGFPARRDHCQAGEHPNRTNQIRTNHDRKPSENLGLNRGLPRRWPTFPRAGNGRKGVLAPASNRLAAACITGQKITATPDFTANGAAIGGPRGTGRNG